MAGSKLRQTDFPLVPMSRFYHKGAHDTRIGVIPIVEIGDWTTLQLSAVPILSSTTPPAQNTSAVLIEVSFYQKSAIDDTAPTFVGGRTLCVGATELRDSGVYPSTIDIRIPINAPYCDIDIAFPSTQTNVLGLELAVWTSNNASDLTAVHWPTGAIYGFGVADSILGGANAGAWGDPSLGIYVPASTTRFVEFTNQMIGKGYFCWSAETSGGILLAANSVGVSVGSKSLDDTTGNTIDQQQYAFPIGPSFAAQGGIPLVGFRQGVIVANSTAPPTDIVLHITGYPEFY